MPAKTNKLSIYLIKPTFQVETDIVDCTRAAISIPGVGNFYHEHSQTHEPSWVASFFLGALNGQGAILSSSARGLLLTPLTANGQTQYMAVAFGVGRHLLKPGVTEERFGLKVVLNSLAPSSLRSIEKTSLGSVPKQSSEQMSRTVSAAEFGIDIEQDLVSSVTGFTQDAEFGKIITGKDALSVSVKVDTSNLIPFLNHCFSRYQSQDYKTHFDWIDQIAEVRNPRKQQALTDALVAKINAQDFSKVWMAVPEVIAWSNVKGFRYGKPKLGDLHDDLNLPEFLADISVAPVTPAALNDKEVFMIGAASDAVDMKWSGFRCIYAEVDLQNELHILNNGKWYQIATNFQTQVAADFAATRLGNVQLPDCMIDDEGAYNRGATSTLANACCMDEQFVQHGGGHSKIEFCDIFASGNQLIHVKRYGGSSVLSHLFAQGVVSAELFVGDEAFRSKLNQILPAGFKLANPVPRPNPNSYEVVYAVISKSAGPLDLPFFSKVTLRNAKRRLGALGYAVSIKKVPRVVSPTNPQAQPAVPPQRRRRAQLAIVASP